MWFFSVNSIPKLRKRVWFKRSLPFCGSLAAILRQPCVSPAAILRQTRGSPAANVRTRCSSPAGNSIRRQHRGSPGGAVGQRWGRTDWPGSDIAQICLILHWHTSGIEDWRGAKPQSSMNALVCGCACIFLRMCCKCISRESSPGIIDGACAFIASDISLFNKSRLRYSLAG